MKKRILATLLSLCMAAALLPASALAEGNVPIADVQAENVVENQEMEPMGKGGGSERTCVGGRITLGQLWGRCDLENRRPDPDY